jgi:NitT/TauT family transport system substrate-binding protein
MSRHPGTGARTAAAASLAVAALGLTACSGAAAGGSASAGGSSEAADSVTMATQPWLGYGPWYIAQENGYFEDEGVDVTITNFETDSDMNAAFASGRIDMANVASHTALKMIEAGMEVKIVLLEDASLTADAILGDSTITSVADLEGQKVAFEEGSVSNLLLGYALEEAGLSLDDIQPVPMSPADAGGALIGGQVPVAVTYEPYISEARSASDSFEPIYTAAENEGLISDVLVVSTDALENKTEAVQKVVDAWGPSIDFYESNTDEARQIIAENIGSAAEDLETAFDGVTFFGLDENAEELGGNYLENTLASVQDIASQIGIVEGGTDLSSVIDTSFVE